MISFAAQNISDECAYNVGKRYSAQMTVNVCGDLRYKDVILAWSSAHHKSKATDW